MHLANQRPGKPDKLSQGAHNQTSYPKIQWENTLDKRGLQNPRGKPAILGGARVETTTEGNARSEEHKVKSKNKNI